MRADRTARTTARTAARTDDRAGRTARADFDAAPAARTSVRERETARREQRQSRRETLAAVPGNVAERVRGIADSPARLRLVIVLAVIGVVFASLYGPVKNYYVALRQRDDLQTYYARLDASNSSLRESIQYLQSREGVEDEARRRGYVYEGETAAEIPGLEDNTNNFTGETDVPKAEEPWYIQALDGLFGYQSPLSWVLAGRLLAGPQVQAARKEYWHRVRRNTMQGARVWARTAPGATRSSISGR